MLEIGLEADPVEANSRRIMNRLFNEPSTLSEEDIHSRPTEIDCQRPDLHHGLLGGPANMESSDRSADFQFQIHASYEGPLIRTRF